MKQSKAYYLMDVDTKQYLNDTDQLSFGNNPIRLTYSDAVRLSKKIQFKTKFSKNIEIVLIK